MEQIEAKPPADQIILGNDLSEIEYLRKTRYGNVREPRSVFLVFQYDTSLEHLHESVCGETLTISQIRSHTTEVEAFRKTIQP